MQAVSLEAGERTAYLQSIGRLPPGQWHTCSKCGAPFAVLRSLRLHSRSGQCLGVHDPIDDPTLTEADLRRLVRARLRWLAGGSR